MQRDGERSANEEKRKSFFRFVGFLSVLFRHGDEEKGIVLAIKGTREDADVWL